MSHHPKRHSSPIAARNSEVKWQQEITAVDEKEKGL
jgi:hypothetical protein